VPRLLRKALEVAGDGRIWLPVLISLLLLSASPANASGSVSPLLADMIDHGCAGGSIPVPNVDARSLATVIKYCNKHVAAAKPSSGSHHGAADGVGSSSSVNTVASEKTLSEWDRKLIDDLTLDFHIVNDFTAEEEAEIRKETPLAFKD
jgi:S-phase kinase-associated protein 1